ncbi:DUF4232 domain-containing protein [Paractinoplanes rishiriensis]|uniref:DUF4232 domain-containing protein n=1 Tax=Paractinoplanes rishiriensis TaxID=1050105 RepID=A0A919JUZ9_9ACTN|nr:DUF4232 domain-containing protein [Actinoplanes rishiriensis]GIE95310.1 hypothetical protein Ari01nite_27750 [Actinoplanes rishiriensis]
MKLTRGLLVTVALLAGCGVSQPVITQPRPSVVDLPAPSLSVTGTPGPPTCPASGVRLELGVVDAAMGLRAMGLGMVNCGGAPYRVSGYPAVRALDENRAALDVRVLDGVTGITGSLPGRDGPPEAFVLRPGERASALVAWRNKYDDTRRPPVEVAYLSVAPRAGGKAQVLTPEGPLDLGSTGRLGVSPWRPVPEPAPARPTPPSTAPATSEPPPPLP